MNRESGAARIFFYNWPVYAGTWAAAMAALFAWPFLPTRLAWILPLFAAVSLLWSIASLVISFYIYDHSELVRGAWLPPLLPARTQSWATVHAGLDAEIDLDAVMPGSCVARLDVFDPRYMSAPSIRRARQRTAPLRPSSPCSPVALALADGACDAVIVAFTAHEVRDRGAREKFLGEVRRCLRIGGRALLVEHLRDAANFLAFGPGFVHFLPRRTWQQNVKNAGLDIVGEHRITPWVMVLTLEKTL